MQAGLIPNQAALDLSESLLPQFGTQMALPMTTVSQVCDESELTRDFSYVNPI